MYHVRDLFIKDMQSFLERHGYNFCTEQGEDGLVLCGSEVQGRFVGDEFLINYPPLGETKKEISIMNRAFVSVHVISQRGMAYIPFSHRVVEPLA